MQNGLIIQGYQNHRLDSGFLTTQKDRQEADLIKFICRIMRTLDLICHLIMVYLPIMMRSRH